MLSLSFDIAAAVAIEAYGLPPAVTQPLAPVAMRRGVLSAPIDLAAGFSGLPPLRFTAEGLPEGLRIGADGRLAGSPVALAQAAAAVVVATDPRGRTVSVPLTVTVYDAPVAFGETDWTLADALTGDGVIVDLRAMPDDCGAAITACEFSVDGGPWRSLGDGAATGQRRLDGLVTGVAVRVTVRAVNVHGAGAPSASKTVTPTGAPSAFVDADWTLADAASPGADRVSLTAHALPVSQGAAISAFEWRVMEGAVWSAPRQITPSTTVFALAVAPSVPATVQIRAVNAAGAGPWSSSRSAFPHAEAPPLFGSGTPAGPVLNPRPDDPGGAGWVSAGAAVTSVPWPGATPARVASTDWWRRRCTPVVAVEAGQTYLAAAVVRRDAGDSARLFLSDSAGGRFARATFDFAAMTATADKTQLSGAEKLPADVRALPIEDLGRGFYRVSALFTPLQPAPAAGLGWTFAIGNKVASGSTAAVQVFSFGVALSTLSLDARIMDAVAPTLEDRLTWLGPDRVVVDVMSDDIIVPGAREGAPAGGDGYLVYMAADAARPMTQLHGARVRRTNATAFHTPSEAAPAAHAPAAWAVIAGGTPVAVTAVHRLSLGSRETRVRAADATAAHGSEPFAYRHRAVLTLAAPVAPGAAVAVTPPGGAPIVGAWSAAALSEAICVSHLGYHPSQQKVAAVWTWFAATAADPAVPANNLSAASIAGAGTAWRLVDADSGAQAAAGTLTWEQGAAVASVLPLATGGTQDQFDTGGPVLLADFSAVATPGHYRLEVEGVGSSVPFRIRQGVDADLVRVTTKAGYVLRRRSAADPRHFPAARPYGDVTRESCAWPHMEARLPILGTSEGPGSGYDKHQFFFESQPYITAVSVAGDGRVTLTLDGDPTAGVLAHTPGPAGGWASGTKVLIVDANSDATGPQIPALSHKIWTVEKVSGDATHRQYILRTADGAAYVNGTGWPAFALRGGRAQRCYIGRLFERVDYGHRDAADLDSRAQHLDMVRAAAALAYFSQRFRTIKAGIPETTGPAVYVLRDRRGAGSDQTVTIPASASDAVKEWCWTLAHFASLQRADGAVHGGAEISRYQLYGGSSYALSPDAVPFVYAPDPFAAWQFAGAAALLAHVLPIICPDDDFTQGVHKTTIDVLRERAGRAFAWAEANRAAYSALPQGVGGAPVSRDSDTRYRRARYAAAAAVALSHAGVAATRAAAEDVLHAERASLSRNTSWDPAVAVWVHACRKAGLAVPGSAVEAVLTALAGASGSWFSASLNRLDPDRAPEAHTHRFGGMLVANDPGMGSGTDGGGRRRSYYDDSVAAPLAALRYGPMAMAFWDDPSVMTAERKAVLRAIVDRETLFTEGGNPYGAPLISGLGPFPMRDIHWRDHRFLGGRSAPYVVAPGPFSSDGIRISRQWDEIRRHGRGGGYPAGRWNSGTAQSDDAATLPASFAEAKPIPGPLFFSDRGGFPLMTETIVHVPILTLMLSGGVRLWLHEEAPA
jgi:hypothetical protein